MELAKINADNDALHAEYSKLILELKEVVQKTTRLQQELHEVYNNFP
jgi:hypothetical protein